MIICVWVLVLFYFNGEANANTLGQHRFSNQTLEIKTIYHNGREYDVFVTSTGAIQVERVER